MPLERAENAVEQRPDGRRKAPVVAVLDWQNRGLRAVLSSLTRAKKNPFRPFVTAFSVFALVATAPAPPAVADPVDSVDPLRRFRVWRNSLLNSPGGRESWRARFGDRRESRSRRGRVAGGFSRRGHAGRSRSRNRGARAGRFARRSDGTTHRGRNRGRVFVGRDDGRRTRRSHLERPRFARRLGHAEFRDRPAGAGAVCRLCHRLDPRAFLGPLRAARDRISVSRPPFSTTWPTVASTSPSVAETWRPDPSERPRGRRRRRPERVSPGGPPKETGIRTLRGRILPETQGERGFSGGHGPCARKASIAPSKCIAGASSPLTSHDVGGEGSHC